MGSGVRAFAASALLLGLGACPPSPPRDPLASVRSWGAITHDGQFVYWAPTPGSAVLRRAPDGGVSTWIADAGSRPFPRVAAGHLLWMGERLSVRPLDGGAVRQVGPAVGSSGMFEPWGRLALVWSPGSDDVTSWDFVTGSHVRSASLPTGRVLGFSAAGEVLGMECRYRADDAGLERALLRLAADGGGFEPFANASCPVGLSYDGPTTYVHDYTPPRGMEPGDVVLRRLEADGTTVRLPVVEALFVRAGVAFRTGDFHQVPVLLPDGGPFVEPDGGVLFQRVARAIEAVSLVDGGVQHVTALDAGLWGFAVDGHASYVLYDGDPTLHVAPLPEVLRSP